MNKPTTDQQAVTVAQLEEWLGLVSGQRALLDELKDRSGLSLSEWVAARMSDACLASVSSASAEGGLTDEAADAYAAEYVMTTEGNDYVPTDWERELIVDALHGFLADCAASPEPVPATNQAGEVERNLASALKQAFQEADPQASHSFDWADFGDYKPTDKGQAVIAALVKSLGRVFAYPATQPATSQEGEAMALLRTIIANEENGEGWADAYKSAKKLIALTATPTPPTLSEDLREEALPIARKLMVEHFGPGKSSAVPADWVIDAMVEFAALAQVKAS